MRPLLNLLGAALALAAFETRGQLAIELRLDQEQFLTGESIPVRVRVANQSGQPLIFGDSPDWLIFGIEAADGYVVTKLADPPVMGEFNLDSAMTATKHVDLAPYFNLTRPGRYLVTATVKVARWGREWTSQPVKFDVTTGRVLWEQEFGVPTQSSAPELRRYALLQANHLKQLKLYARVADAADGSVRKVFAIGPVVSFSKPEAQLDRQSRLHVLFQIGARAFQYTVITPDGEIVTRQTHDYSGSRPTLKLTEDLNIVVAGGARRVTAGDLPPPRDEDFTDGLPTSKAP
jgi:hypothetical protein